MSAYGEDGRNVPLQVDKCKFDNGLDVKPPMKSWQPLRVRNQCGETVCTFPYLSAFINSACIAYTDHNGAALTQSKKNNNSPETSDESDQEILVNRVKDLQLNDVFEKPDAKRSAAKEDKGEIVDQLSHLGFEFLAEARNESNGYRGVVYVNEIKRQVILSHRGTKLSNLGSVRVDVNSVWRGKYTSHLSSAITFAHHVAQYAQKTKYQFFFTGHSLGAWLAQITCFSTKYLQLQNNTGHFVRKSPDNWDEVHPYTVVFDSPGALEFLRRMQDDLTLGQHPLTQKNINVRCLAVEVFQFLPNSVNNVNTQVGSVYLVNLKKAKLEYSYVWLGNKKKPIVKGPHAKDPVRNLIASKGTEKSEKNVVESQVYHWKLGDDWSRKLLDKWWNEGRSVVVNLNRFAEYFLTAKELEKLKEQSGKEVNGRYEGLSSEEETIANKIVQYSRREGGVFAEGCVQLGEELDRREAIPLVRQFVEALGNKTIWWNPKKPQLPEKYVERSVEGPFYFEFDERQFITVQPRTLTEELIKSDKLVLLVDAPGMGKSSEMTHLEHKLRVGVTSNRVILRVNLNEVQTALKNLSFSDNVNSVLLKLAHPFLPPESLQTPPLSLFILLDGLDEVCPKHQQTMINLLQILTSTEEDSQGRNIRVVVTTRPHLRETVESEFKLKSWSLLPLTEEEQDEYVKEVLGVSGEQMSGIRGKLADSVKDLLSIPLMLYLFVDVIKSGETFASKGGRVVNIFELYTNFVESKHKLHLVEKEKMGAEDNFTEMRLEGMLERNLPQYYRVALNMIIEESEGNLREELLRECGGRVVVANDEPSGVTKDELLSFGLLLEDGSNRFVFKHRSFGEFFYARLLTQEESLPQLVRDALFGNFFMNDLENVEAFVAAAAAHTALAQVASPSSSSSAPMANRPKLTSSRLCHSTGAAAVPQSPSSLLFTLSPKWILREEDFSSRCEILKTFVNRSKLFPLLAREVLMSFVKGDNLDAPRKALKVLLHTKSEEAFPKLFGWMRENVEWTREELLQLSGGKTKKLPQPVAHLITGITVTFQDKCHRLFSEEEVGVAVNSVDRKLIAIVLLVKSEEGRSLASKWEWVERHLPGGRSQLRNIFLQMDNEDLFAVIKDKESVWKLVQILSRAEIWALVTNEETRVGDVIGVKPWGVVVALGEEFLPPKQLAEFRSKFCAKEEDKGKTVFEMSWEVRDFAVEYLWGELVGEAERGDRSGPVGVALSEALGRMQGWDSWDLLTKLEEREESEEVQRRRRSQHGTDKRVSERSGDEKMNEVGGVTMKTKAVVMEWVAGGALQWRDISDITLSLQHLPLLLRYYGNATPSHLTTFLEKNKGHHLHQLMDVLRSLLVILSSPFSSLDSSLFSTLTSFLRENINEITEECRSLVEVFLGATREEIQAAAAPLHLVRDVCVGGLALNLLTTTTQQPSLILEKETWAVIVVDVIKTAGCCDLRVLLLQLRTQMGDNHLERMKEVLTSEEVIYQWRKRFWSGNRREWEESCDWMCGLRHLLTFHLSVFGSDNLEWMKKGGWELVRDIPVEIATVLQGEEIKKVYPNNNKLVEMFTELVRKLMALKSVSVVNQIGGWFCYKTEWEWEALINLLGGENALLQGGTFTGGVFSASIAAPLIRVLIRMFGVEWTTTWLRTHHLWKGIPSTEKYREDTVEPFGSLLHSAIELGELEEVKRRAFPGLALSWRNNEGKTALEVAKETRTKDVEDKNQMIVQHLADIVSSIQR